MSLTSEIFVKLSATQAGGNALRAQTFSPVVEKVIQLASGTAANQADIFWGDKRTLAASASEDIDLSGTLVDAFGNTVAAVDVVAFLIVADNSNTNDVVISPGASAGAPILGGTSPTVPVKPGGVFLLACGVAGGQFAVTATTADIVTVTNGGAGTPVTYSIAVIGRSA